ncbi:hypothetical protein ACHAWU_006138 [Discostella pseudostelligera]|uniref:BZIP domain-containing protein n=1 Tax=Discostella pseudostelligera TaxID=259834 RepID=A0ABD3MBB9_9STRA
MNIEGGDDTTAGEIEGVAVAAPPAPTSIPPDNNWRVKRAVVSREKKLAKLNKEIVEVASREKKKLAKLDQQNKEMRASNDSLKRRISELKSQIELARPRWRRHARRYLLHMI